MAAKESSKRSIRSVSEALVVAIARRGAGRWGRAANVRSSHCSEAPAREDRPDGTGGGLRSRCGLRRLEARRAETVVTPTRGTYGPTVQARVAVQLRRVARACA